MEKQNNWRIAILILVIIALACSTGTSTSHSISGDQGTIVVKIKSADGTDQTGIEINEEWAWETVPMAITVTVEAGSYQATFIDHEEQSITLDAKTGNPASIRTQMVTDGFGKIILQSEASGAEGVTITIDYTVIYP